MSLSSLVLDEQDKLLSCIDDALMRAKKLGATEAQASVAISAGLSTQVRLGKTEQMNFHKDKGFGITVYCGKQKGTSSTTDLAPQAIEEAVQAAYDIARLTKPDPYHGLPDEACLANIYPDLKLHYDWAIEPAQAITLAQEMENEALSYDKVENSEGASVSTGQGLHVLGNSFGFRGFYPTSRHSLSVVAVAGAGDNMQRDYWSSSRRSPDDLDSPKSVGLKAAERAVERLNPQAISTRKVPIIFEASMASSLIGHLIGAISGSSLYRKASFLLDAKGQQLFPSWVQIEEKPHLHGEISSSPFDSEGVKTQDRYLIKDGILQGYVLSSYSARKLGLETTGNAGGTHNLRVNNSGQDLPALMKQAGRGVLVTELIGQGVNLVTGEYSRGASGFWFENGEIVHPVENITIAGQLKDMFSQIVAIGSDVDKRGGLHMGSVLLSDMMVAAS